MLRKFIINLVNIVIGEQNTQQLVKKGLKTGKNFSKQRKSIIDPSHCWLISIGDDVTLAPRAYILAHDASTKNYLGYVKIGRVNIGNRVFVGANSIILPNVNIGDNVIIGANSTVTSNIESNSVVAGNPAKFICTIEEYINKNSELIKVRPKFSKSYTIKENISENMKQEMIDKLADGIGFIE